ncbi:MAG TPA: hypothetical protein PLK76_00255 [bacterium]|nr:hypothetical protein [bacterium]
MPIPESSLLHLIRDQLATLVALGLCAALYFSIDRLSIFFEKKKKIGKKVVFLIDVIEGVIAFAGIVFMFLTLFNYFDIDWYSWWIMLNAPAR